MLRLVGFTVLLLNSFFIFLTLALDISKRLTCNCFCSGRHWFRLDDCMFQHRPHVYERTPHRYLYFPGIRQLTRYIIFEMYSDLLRMFTAFTCTKSPFALDRRPRRASLNAPSPKLEQRFV